MARKVLQNAKRYTFNAEAHLIAASVTKAGELGYSFSEYLSRLLIADLRRKNTAADSVPRILRDAPATAATPTPAEVSL
jgi:hypothetical protein